MMMSAFPRPVCSCNRSLAWATGSDNDRLSSKPALKWLIASSGADILTAPWPASRRYSAAFTALPDSPKWRASWTAILWVCTV